MDVLLDALGYQARQPHQEDVSTSSTDAHEELLEDRAFWTWATVEVLRLTGVRIEELPVARLRTLRARPVIPGFWDGQ
jgi:hypothetical protein